MSKIAELKSGMLLTNADLHTYFKVGNSGGMRRSKTHNCLIIICDHSKSLYDDKWHGDVLHYTGMGKVGDQSFLHAQNKTVFLSGENNVTLYLFERFDGSKPYTFHGECILAEKPYLARQFDEDKNMRNVCIFPLKLKGAEQPVIFSYEEREKSVQRKRREAKKFSIEQLTQLENIDPPAGQGERKNAKPGSSYIRDELVKEYALRRAGKNCQLCKKEAPFFKKDNSPFLEVHHVVWLSKGGIDWWNNVVALCPNCHRKMHVLNDKKDVESLKSQAKISIET